MNGRSEDTFRESGPVSALSGGLRTYVACVFIALFAVSIASEQWQTPENPQSAIKSVDADTGLDLADKPNKKDCKNLLAVNAAGARKPVKLKHGFKPFFPLNIPLKEFVTPGSRAPPSIV